ncbi:hypothetical protein O6H91_01G078500 [Diphasiastrum complanatum]|uniref:Uncharacterized protein n=1 Tax=Diphasiastrum complanatum TaxID=34168 RepID=A0ACC2ESX6_DIPCM|nr:hypothetical protein O6H91_01G078500 [Diphasiastrum complanatum]
MLICCIVMIHSLLQPCLPTRSRLARRSNTYGSKSATSKEEVHEPSFVSLSSRAAATVRPTLRRPQSSRENCLASQPP